MVLKDGLTIAFLKYLGKFPVDSDVLIMYKMNCIKCGVIALKRSVGIISNSQCLFDKFDITLLRSFSKIRANLSKLEMLLSFVDLTKKSDDISLCIPELQS